MVKVEVRSGEISFSSVTVFKDRAEVTRSATLTVPTSGEHEIKFTRLCTSIDSDSIRVKGGSEQLSIVEVSHEIVSIVEDDANYSPDSESVLKDELIESEKKIKRIQAEIALHKSRKKVTELYVNGSFSPSSTTSTQIGYQLDDVKQVLNFYAEEMSKLDDLIFQFEENLSVAQERVQVIKDKLK
jgi:hypothetical protein